MLVSPIIDTQYIPLYQFSDNQYTNRGIRVVLLGWCSGGVMLPGRLCLKKIQQQIVNIGQIVPKDSQYPKDILKNINVKQNMTVFSHKNPT